MLLTDSKYNRNSQKSKFSDKYLGTIQYHNYGELIGKHAVGDLVSRKLTVKRISEEIQAEAQDTYDTICEKLSGNSENCDFEYDKKIHVEKPFSISKEVDFAKFPAMVADTNNQTSNKNHIPCHKF